MKAALITLLSLITCFTLCAQDKTELRIDSVVRHQQWLGEIPGYAVGVIVGNKIIYRKALGLRSLSKPESLAVNSDFHLASVSKPVAATAILKLVEKGKLSLHQRVTEYLPNFKMKDDRYREITLHHILTHTSGIPDVRNYEWHAPQKDDKAADRYTQTFSEATLDFAPGEQFRYSNASFNLLASVIANVSGMTFEEYVYCNIFLPAKMGNTTFLFDSIPATKRTAPHVLGPDLYQTESDVYPYNRIHAPSSTLHSNVEDMLLWSNVWLQQRGAMKSTILNDSSFKGMLQPQRRINDVIQICLSWFQTTIAGKEIYYHSGGDLGYRSFMGFEPATGTAVVLMGNNDLFDGAQFGFDIFRAIFSSDSLRLRNKSIAFELNRDVLKKEVAAIKQEYFRLKSNDPGKYDFSATAVANVAEWLFDRGHKQKAIEVLEFCTALEPKESRWYEYIGDVYKEWNKKKQAYEWYEKALSLAPEDQELQGKLKNVKPGNQH